MGDSRGIMKVNFITRKKRRGNVESGAQRERIKRGSGERNGEEREKMPKKESSGGRSEQGSRGTTRRATEEAESWPVRRKLPSVVDSESAGYQSNPIPSMQSPLKRNFPLSPFRTFPPCSAMGEARIARWDESKWRMIPGYPLSSNYEEGRKSGAVKEINAGLLWPRSRAFVSTSHHCVA